MAPVAPKRPSHSCTGRRRTRHAGRHRAEGVGEAAHGAPHERAVNAQQPLRVDCVRLVKDNADLVVVPLERLDGLLELIRDVQLVRVEQKKDDVGARREPAAHRGEHVRAADALLLAREHAGRVDQGDVLQKRRVELRALELGQEAVAKHLQPAEGHVG
eukprot:scaffold7401_cov108-Isochrysis_galbana.AAC.2